MEDERNGERFVVMFKNNCYMKNNTIFSTYDKPRSGKYINNPITGGSDYVKFDPVELEKLTEEWERKMLDRHTTPNLQEARIFNTRSAAGSACGRSGLKAGKDYEYLPVFLTTTLSITE